MDGMRGLLIDKFIFPIGENGIGIENYFMGKETYAIQNPVPKIEEDDGEDDGEGHAWEPNWFWEDQDER